MLRSDIYFFFKSEPLSLLITVGVLFGPPFYETNIISSTISYPIISIQLTIVSKIRHILHKSLKILNIKKYETILTISSHFLKLENAITRSTVKREKDYHLWSIVWGGGKLRISLNGFRCDPHSMV